MKLTFNPIGLAQLLSAAMLSTVIALGAFGALSWSVDRELWTPRTHEVIVDIGHTVSLLRDAENAQIHSLVGRHDDRRGSREPEVDVLKNQLATLGDLIRDNPGQQSGFARLNSLVSEELTDLREQVEVHADQGLEAALRRIRADREKGIVNKIERATREMRGVEYEQRAKRIATATWRCDCRWH